MNVITISREFGSGGRELGKRLADALGYRYYDREIIEAIAKETSLDEQYIERTLENGAGAAIYPITFSRSFGYLAPVNTHYFEILARQQEIIKRIPEHGNCVIVGRSADSVLAEYNPVKIFVYADMTSKLARCKARAKNDEALTDKQLIRKIKKLDKVRKQTHDMYSSTEWGDKKTYNLCINTTGVDIKELAIKLAEYLKLYIKD